MKTTDFSGVHIPVISGRMLVTLGDIDLAGTFPERAAAEAPLHFSQ